MRGRKSPLFSHLLLGLLRLLYTIFSSSEYASLVTQLLTESGGVCKKGSGSSRSLKDYHDFCTIQQLFSALPFATDRVLHPAFCFKYPLKKAVRDAFYVRSPGFCCGWNYDFNYSTFQKYIFRFGCLIHYLADPPLWLVFSSMSFQMILFSSPVVGDVPIVNSKPASNALWSKSHISFPSELCGRKAEVYKGL